MDSRACLRDTAWRSVTTLIYQYFTNLSVCLNTRIPKYGYRCTFTWRIHPAYSSVAILNNCLEIKEVDLFGDATTGRPAVREIHRNGVALYGMSYYMVCRTIWCVALYGVSHYMVCRTIWCVALYSVSHYIVCRTI